MFDERHEDVEDLGSERNQFTFAQQDTLRRFQAETTEFIALTFLLTHEKTALRNIFEEILSAI